MSLRGIMAQQLLGRSHSCGLLVAHVLSLFSPPLSSLPPRFLLNKCSAKYGALQPSPSLAFRSLLCTTLSQPPAALINEKQRLLSEEEDEEEEYENEEEEYEAYEEEEEEEDVEELEKEKKLVVSSLEQKKSISSRRIPQLTTKEKKELRAYAHSLGRKLRCHQVGKSGVTLSVETSVSDALEANELVKLKVHDNCPDDVDVVALQLQESTRSVVVGQIGHTFILYRPSHRKVATAEKQQSPQRPHRRRIGKSSRWKNRKA